ncbi:hypothetical protein K4K49_001810 [Colletotrichum sp. SAR 10_70]|nr:hypothetical protein K4K50_000674 [Colletotrichum sp. SAR 10_71]KAI8178766.1 hypothetical protein K4K49_001810 [Colletotrichum sp. SAR 10_70]KAI8184627.1 hypothetical protein KHU50_001925 [Colletotrichum sp. SAR 10_65]KAJ5001297.1 hypothetical protein K4K48_001596 [Colletotrichum sp. SAR 10_66]
MYKPKASRHPMIYSKENEWAIIDDEEEEEKERQRLRQAERLKVGCFVAALTVVLVPTICGFVHARVEPEMSDPLDDLFRTPRVRHHGIRAHLGPLERSGAERHAQRHRDQHVSAFRLDREPALDGVLLEDPPLPPRVADAGRVVRDHQPGQTGRGGARGGVQRGPCRAAR